MKYFKGFFSKKRYNEPLFKRIVVVVLAFVVMVGTSAILAGNMIASRLSSQAEAVVTQAIMKLDGDLVVPSTTVYYTSETVRAMLMHGADAEIISANLGEISASFQRVQPTGLVFSGVYGYFNIAGKGVFVDAAGVKTTGLENIENQTWYSDALRANGELATTQVFTSEQLGGQAISFSRLILDAAGDALGVVAVDISLESLRNYFVDMRFSSSEDGSYGFLMNSDLVIIAHPNATLEGMDMRNVPVDSDEFEADSDDLEEVLGVLEDAIATGTEHYEYEMDDYRGDNMMASSAFMPNGWIVTLATPVREYYGDLIRMEVVLFVLGTVLASVLIFMLVRLDKARKAAEDASKQKSERLEMMEKLRQADERVKIIFDATPVASVMFNEAGVPIDCNRAAQELFGMPNKDEMIEHFWDLHPKTQPSGRLSVDMSRENQHRVLRQGRVKFEWMFILPGEQQMPAEVTLIMVMYHGQPMVAGYYRDLREFKAMLSAIGARTAERDAQYNKLAAVTKNYKGIVWSVDNNGILTTFRGQYLEKLGFEPAFVEGSPVRDVQPLLQVDFTEYAEKTRLEGPQDWTMEMGGAIFHAYTVPIYDEEGHEAGIVGSIDDVTEEENLKRELEEALAGAEVANKAKSTFLANMSHEIRTPMNAILGITEILVANENLPDDIMEGLSKIYASCDLLLGIINDVLDFSKIEAGKLDITPASYEIASMMNDSIQLNMMRIGSKPIEFKIQVDENIPAKLVGDELRIKQILNNLLSNAFKYTDSGTVTLCIGFEPAEDNKIMLVLAVQDTGQGMTKEQVDKLFDEYTRFQAKNSSIVEGTGLGMAITQRLVHLMDGDIRASSEPGAGSLFVVVLPQGSPTAEILGTEVAENLRNFNMGNFTNRKRAQVVREPMPYGKVLVVDDVETNIYVAVGLLKMYELKIDTAMSGYEAIEKIKDGNTYDIVFMDHMMPGMNGIETTKYLRELGYKQPIVALTANAVAKQADMFVKNGFDDFIAKPIDIRQLGNVLNRLVRDKQPPEVLKAARRKKRAQPQSAQSAKPALDPMLVSSFVRDAKKAIAVLESFDKAPVHSLDDEVLESCIQQFTISVHGMKSALANIGERALSAVAKQLEAAGKRRDTAVIVRQMPDFLQELRVLVEKLAPENDVHEATTSDDVPDLREKLNAIVALCEDYERKGVMDILGELAKENLPGKTRETLESIQEAVLHSDFDEAAQLAVDYVTALNVSDKAEGKEFVDFKIKGLDVARGIAKYDGDEKAYRKIMRSYALSVERLLADCEQMQENSLAEYEIAVHGIKGASKDVFADTLAENAARLEEAAKAGDAAYINRHKAAFAKEAHSLYTEIIVALAAIDAQNPRPKKNKPNAEMLAQLCKACEVYDMDGIDDAMAQIDAYEYETDAELAAWLRERADMADFSSIAEKLLGYKEKGSV